VSDRPGHERLRWLCRRGMLELDTWFTRFLEAGYPGLSPERQTCFVALLAQDDLALFDWLTGERAPPAEYSTLVDLIKTTR